MPTIETETKVTTPQTCPLCDAPLDPAHPDECPRCDWIPGYRRRQLAPVGTARDTAAMLMSCVPGLGHIYKGHRVLGGILALGGAFAIFWCGLAATATMGLGLLMIPIYWAGVMLHAFWAEDLRAPK